MGVAAEQLLFPNRVMHALNALQHLRVLYMLGDCTDHVIYSTCEQLSREIGAPSESLHRTLMMLTRSGIIEAKRGRDGGYHITPRSLFKHKVSDVLSALGTVLPDNGNTRASDRLNNAVADCLNVTLEEFFK